MSTRKWIRYVGVEELSVNDFDRRDMFAAAALQGLLADPYCDGTKEGMAKLAWELAELMLKLEPEE